MREYDEDNKWKLKDKKVYDEMPKGWRIIEGATTHPKGYKWISNGKSLFSGERETAYLKIKE